MTRPRSRRKRQADLAWTDLRQADEVAFCAAWVWLSESASSESGRPVMPAGAGSPLEDTTEPNPANSLACWGHCGPPRGDMASRVLVEHFGSLSEARRVYRTLSKHARDERPGLAAFMGSLE